MHARKAWLKGLKTKKNREVPPLKYDIAHDIKGQFPSLKVIVNGGIRTSTEIAEHLLRFDGVMIGREAYQNPYFLAEIERTFFENGNPLPREAVAEAMIPYISAQGEKYGTPAKTITRHMIGLYHGQRDGRQRRRPCPFPRHAPTRGLKPRNIAPIKRLNPCNP